MVAQAEPCIVLLTLPFLICKHHTHRPTQTYASTDADIRTDRRRRAHRSTRMTKELKLQEKNIRYNM
uniref:hypothetical protein n=1 Tax=Leyella stercorea TaxID=363265 RepID=UPI003FEEA428